jgi:hypothetical protein
MHKIGVGWEGGRMEGLGSMGAWVGQGWGQWVTGDPKESCPPSHSICTTNLCSCVAECHDEAIRAQV